MSDVKGWIFDIKRFAVRDGPGVRTAIFLKGCPLRCWWCHNPESFSRRPQLVWLDSKCIGCGACFQACPNGVHELSPDGRHLLHGERCTQCGRCVAECFPEALTIEGRLASVSDVMDVIRRDRDFYAQSGGGVTLSGGEPLAQPDFTAALLDACKSTGLHTALDTCGHCGWDVLEPMLGSVDLILYDLKHMDPALHQKYTGSGNGRILDNLRRISERGFPIEVRMPLIPSLNDDGSSLAMAGQFLASLPGILRIRLLPYHRLAEGKYQRLGLSSPMPPGIQPPRPEDVQRATAVLRGLGLAVVA